MKQTLSVRASNSCGNSGPRNTTVRSVPVTPGTMTGTATVCANQTGALFYCCSSRSNHLQLDGAHRRDRSDRAGDGVGDGKLRNERRQREGAIGQCVRVKHVPHEIGFDQLSR